MQVFYRNIYENKNIFCLFLMESNKKVTKQEKLVYGIDHNCNGNDQYRKKLS